MEDKLQILKRRLERKQQEYNAMWEDDESMSNDMLDVAEELLMLKGKIIVLLETKITESEGANNGQAISG